MCRKKIYAKTSFLYVHSARDTPGEQRARRDTERARRARSVVCVDCEFAPPPPRVVSSSLSRRKRTCGLFLFASERARVQRVMKGKRRVETTGFFLFLTLCRLLLRTFEVQALFLKGCSNDVHRLLSFAQSIALLHLLAAAAAAAVTASLFDGGHRLVVRCVQDAHTWYTEFPRHRRE